MNNARRAILILVAIILIAWTLWSRSDRTHALGPVELSLDQVHNIHPGLPCDRNVVGIQPYMLDSDYLSEAGFNEKLTGYFKEAQRAGFLHEKTIVLLPEYLGTWLVVEGEKETVASYVDLQSAMTVMVLSNPVAFIIAYLNHGNEEDKLAAALFRMKAASMAKLYGSVFKRLASDFHVTIVAGSIVLPGPQVSDNEIIISPKDPLYNASFVFYPDGTIDPKVVRKSFLIGSELPFLTAAPMEQLPSFELGGSKTAVLVCADSWYPESYSQVAASGASLVLVPSYCTGDQTMSMKWGGYDGSPMPRDVDKEDVGKIAEADAWVRYAMPGRIASSKATTGVNVFLRGELWDLGSDGQPLFVQEGRLLAVPTSDHAGIWNLCY